MLLASLVGFNIGVEIGQLGAVAVAAAVAALLARTMKQLRPVPSATGAPAMVVSALLLAVGTAWFLTRAFAPTPM
jgi:O-antigen ligase